MGTVLLSVGKMSQFRRVFFGWFTVLLVFFLLANFAGLVRPRELKLPRSMGFPLIIAVWGKGVEPFFDWSALFLNVALAVLIAGLVGCLCAWVRCRSLIEEIDNRGKPISATDPSLGSDSETPNSLSSRDSRS
jgi:hypothetical protein